MGPLSKFEPILRENEPLAPHTWFQVGGPAQYFATPRNEDELADLVRRCRDEDIHVRLLGGGSNILVRDAGVTGVVVRLDESHFGTIEATGDIVRAGGAARLGQVISTSVGKGLAGLESLVGIPGTIGGALHGNTGGRGGDIGQ
ncbi:MAG: FAD-binding protein, partial [Planctomycetales bacterium]|nr:FAD-binding protein [Planctomycetales bacterium]